MNALRAVVVAAAVAVVMAGCVQVPKEINVNLGSGGGSAKAAQQPAPQAEPEPVGQESRAAEPQGPPAAEAEESPAASQLQSPGGWRDIATEVAGKVILGAENGVLFYAFDTLAYPRQPVDLIATLTSVRDMSGIAGATIAFGDEDERLATAVTDRKGVAAAKWTPPAIGDYKLSARIVELPEGAAREMLAVEAAPLLVAARDASTAVAVIDLDHTVVDSSFFRVLLGGAKPMGDSVRVTNRIAKVYSIVYLTHRPDLLTRKSKAWLAKRANN